MRPPFSFAEFLVVMSPYNFDPEASALLAEFKEARAKKSGLASVRTKILAFIARKKAAREAMK